MIGIISNPVNSVVPIACDTLLKAGVLDTRCMFGISTVEIIRANTFISEVIGRQSGETIIPVHPRASAALTEHIQELLLLSKVNDYEQELLKKVIPKLIKNIQKGEEFDMNKKKNLDLAENGDDFELEEVGFSPAISNGGGPRCVKQGCGVGVGVGVGVGGVGSFWGPGVGVGVVKTRTAGVGVGAGVG
ncbi:malate dehydrogenase [Culex quinquefasciatus]|uniref:Malate dehydrogenase n=1 Tax=Culex quinquefasciatus TaxID=7176 RepID=B0VZ12_CULQU|nr:malate dehydrogenase [Culex quinquefasciatus]|eukprot:XP_001841671.1 malate dehydrogenase [Culex quinquefasciatus]